MLDNEKASMEFDLARIGWHDVREALLFNTCDDVEIWSSHVQVDISSVDE